MEFEHEGVRIKVPERAEAISSGEGSASSSGTGIAGGSVAIARKSPALATPPPFFDILVSPPSPASRFLSIMDNFSDENNSSSSSSNEPEYESLPETVSTSTHMIAGAVAGVLEHCVMYPIDCVKVLARQPCRPLPGEGGKRVQAVEKNKRHGPSALAAGLFLEIETSRELQVSSCKEGERFIPSHKQRVAIQFSVFEEFSKQ